MGRGCGHLCSCGHGPWSWCEMGLHPCQPRGDLAGHQGDLQEQNSPARAALCFPALWHAQSCVFEPSPVATWMFPSDSKNGDWCNCWFPGALKQIIRSHRTRCKMEASCFTRYRGSKCQSSEHFQHRCHRALPWEGKMPWVCWE